jgi:hypothetical protein
MFGTFRKVSFESANAAFLRMLSETCIRNFTSDEIFRHNVISNVIDKNLMFDYSAVNASRAISLSLLLL